MPEEKVEKLLQYLQTEYSSKFKLKSYTDNQANFNVR
jgi:hypothetical protein